MEICIIHGQMHKGSTYHITEQLKNKICRKETVVHEFFLPKDMPYPCTGCFLCIKKGEQYCPHQEGVSKIIKAMESCDIIIIDSPTYCMSMTGQLKTLFDHLAFMWMSHRPKGILFHKTGVAISTTAGVGAKKVTKSIQEQLFWIGVSTCYKIPVRVSASSWDEVSIDIKQKIEILTDRIAKKVLKNRKTSFRLKIIFRLMRLSQKANKWNVTDRNYWDENGWLGKEYPWKYDIYEGKDNL